MTDLIQNHQNAIEVFFDDDESITLQTVEKYQDSIRDIEGVTIDFDELVMSDGTILTPAEYLIYESDTILVEFAEELEPVPDTMDGPLIRTREHGDNLRFLEAVRLMGGNALKLEASLQVNERKDAEEYAHRLTQFLSPKRTLWLRLEAGANPDDDVIGKTIIARLAIFMTQLPDEQSVGIVPVIYDMHQSYISPIPEQLRLVDPWLYVEIDA